MAYFMRAFCRRGEVPSAGFLADYLKSKAIDVTFESSSDAAEEASGRAVFRYESDKTPIEVECNCPQDQEGLFEAEIGEFLEQIGLPGLSLAKRRVIRHLKQTKFILAVRLPGDIESAGFRVSDAILHYCIDHCGALIQADGEGFYRGTKLILPLH